jgi:prepilin-type N-terminal cleavage/methylation domain-containing protein
VLQRLRELRENNDGGFTLIELLVTVIILGVLAGIVVFSVSKFNDDGKAAACKADAKNVEIAAEAHYAKSNPHAWAADINALVTAGYLKEAPSSSDYTISFNSTTGKVTATGACTIS